MDILLCERINDANEYTELLAKAYQRFGHRVIFDVQNFLYSDFMPDCVHIQWPEAVYRWRHQLPMNNDTLKLLRQRLSLYSSRKIPIVYTAHNLLPHDNVSDFDKAAYNTILAYAKIIVHHGKASIPLLQNDFPECVNARHVVCPHGPYPYKSEDGYKARALFGLPVSRYIFLNFGRQRPNKGMKFINRAFKKWAEEKALLFTIGPIILAGRNNGYSGLMNLVMQKFIDPRLLVLASTFSKRSKCVLRPVGTNEIPKIISAADVFFLGHQEGLNSGLLALAASYGKPVVYPDLCNFSEQLSCWPWKEQYKAGDGASAVKALERMMARLNHIPPGQVMFDNKEWLSANSWDKHVQIITTEIQRYHQK